MNMERNAAHFVGRIAREFSQARERYAVSTAIANAVARSLPI
jgi:hypothetical protein